MTSKISWTDETWNPTVGCARVSPGCTNCYAEHVAAMVNRTQGEASAYRDLIKLYARLNSGVVDPRWTGRARFLPERLAIPFGWRAPRRVFVDSMSDLFHDDITDEQIAAVFGVMAATPKHTYQVLTKRPERMRAWFRWVSSARVPFAGLPDHSEHVRERSTVCRYAWSGPLPDQSWGLHPSDDVLEFQRGPWPLPNVWLGVSAEDQEHADERLPVLLEVPAAVRFVSAEPLLSRLSLWEYLRSPGRDRAALIGQPKGAVVPPGLDWVIAGGESGPGARPCSSEWLRALRDEVTAADIPFFLKQSRPAVGVTAGAGSVRARGVIELPYLDGVQHTEFPAVSS